MPLNLNDLIKKAESKGIKPNAQKLLPTLPSLLRPWQHDSVLFAPSEDRPKENRQQSGNKVTTNRQQTDNKVTTNWQQKDTSKQETGNKVATQPTTQVTTNWQQSDNKLTTKHAFSSLVGLQRSIIIFLYNECKNTRSKTTKNLTLEHFSNALKTSKRCIKTTTQRLEAKNLVQRVEYKNGRGGWTKYGVTDTLYQELLQYETDNKLATNWQQTGNKVVTQPTTQPTTSPPSSSGNINNDNKTTTTSDEGEKSKDQLVSEEWQNLDIEPLSNFGFTKTHLLQIATQSKLTIQAVQDSVYAFAFDLKENDKAKSIKGDTINFFMGILRNGKPYAPPSNYESPQDKAMRIYLERMREIEKKRVEAEKEVFTLEFNNWFRSLSDEQKRNFLPEAFRRSNPNLENNKILESSARNHFEKETWAHRKAAIQQTTPKTEVS